MWSQMFQQKPLLYLNKWMGTYSEFMDSMMIGYLPVDLDIKAFMILSIFNNIEQKLHKSSS